MNSGIIYFLTAICEVTGQEIPATSSLPVKFSGLNYIPILILTFLSCPDLAQGYKKRSPGFCSDLNTWVGGWYDPRGFIVDKGETQSFVTKGQYKHSYIATEMLYIPTNPNITTLHSTVLGWVWLIPISSRFGNNSVCMRIEK